MSKIHNLLRESTTTNSNSQAGSSTESDSGVDSVTDTQPLRDSSRTSGRY